MRSRSLIAALALLATVLAAAPASSDDFPPQIARGVVVPAGFVARVFANTPPGYLPTSLTWGDAPNVFDAALGPMHGTLLYVTAVSGNAFAPGNGSVLTYEDEGLAPTVVATGLDLPLGLVVGPANTLYVTENAAARGRVSALQDLDSDGVYEAKRTVIKNLPNGRHQTNGLAFGSDGMLYVANGNATDNGVECGPELVPGSGVECAQPEVLPWSGAILRVDPDWTDVDLLTDVRVDDDAIRADDGLDDESVLVAAGFRNIYDVDFDPQRPTQIWTAMNGPDNPSGSEPLYGLDVADERVVGFDPDGNAVLGPVIEDAGFPSCLYDPHENEFPKPQLDSHEHPGFPEPQDSPSQKVIDQFGPCQPATVLRPKVIFDDGHEGTSGVAFERGSNFPDRYDGDLFVAQWGSLWNLNGGAVTGHKLMHVDVSPERGVVREREFLSGALPIDVTFGANGRMYVADMGGQIYEVFHVSDAVTPDEVTVDMRSGQFVPQVVTIVRGQTVRWVNADTVEHNVRAVQKVKVVDPAGAEPALQPGAEMNSVGNIAPGSSHSHTFDGETAVYHYQSTVTGLESNTMRGTVVVLPVER